MSSKKQNSLAKQIILILLVSIAFVIGACFAFVHILKNIETPPPSTPPTDEEEEDEVLSPPTLTVPNEISIKLLNNSTVFSYQTENLGEYVVSCSVLDTSVANIDSNLTITPLKVGTTKIITTINCEPSVTRETTLTILPVVSDVEFNILNSNNDEIDEFYTNTPYTLVVRENVEDNETPEMVYSENISNFEFIKKEQTSYYFSFKIIEFGNFTFTYETDYYDETVTFYSYTLPTDFNVNFENLKDNTLYLFDSKFLSSANLDKVYNECVFSTTSQENTNDNIKIVSYNKNIIEIVGNKIIAKNKGETNVVFENKFGITKVYEIFVKEVGLNAIRLNNNDHKIGEEITLLVKNGESVNFAFDKIPEYAYDNLTMVYNKDEIEYDNNKLKLINDTNFSVVLIKNKINQTVLTVNIETEVSYKLEIFLTNQNYLPVTLENSVLKVGFNKNEYVQISCYCLNELTNNKTQVQKPKVDIADKLICDVEDEIINGNINIKIKQTGTTTIKISYEDFNVEVNLTIIIE